MHRQTHWGALVRATLAAALFTVAGAAHAAAGDLDTTFGGTGVVNVGPVVEEPLPVVVRAAEAAEGRARLYRRAGARGRAAQNLRAATLGRLMPLLGQGRAADPVSVTAAVAARAARPAAEVSALLYGAAPADDAALVRLANELDALERMVRHP